MKNLSVVISAYNEEKNITDCLSSVSWADEMIVIDNDSTDKTKDIAVSLGAKVFNQPNRLMLNINKNIGFEHASGTWILNLDADEVVTKELKTEILEVLKRKDDVSGFAIPRKNILFGKWIQHGLWWPDYQLRLFKKGKGSFPCKHVHEYIQVQGETENLTQPLIHHNYQTVSQYLHKLTTIYTENEAENKIKNDYSLQWYDALRFPLSDFLSVYFVREGYKDGLHGLVLAIFQAFYSFVVFTRVWEAQGFEEREISNKEIEDEFTHASKEFSFWRLSHALKSTNNPIKQIVSKVKRKLL